jgi:hypothetical protein
MSGFGLILDRVVYPPADNAISLERIVPTLF